MKRVERVDKRGGQKWIEQTLEPRLFLNMFRQGGVSEMFLRQFLGVETSKMMTIRILERKPETNTRSRIFLELSPSSREPVNWRVLSLSLLPRRRINCCHLLQLSPFLPVPVIELCKRKECTCLLCLDYEQELETCFQNILRKYTFHTLTQLITIPERTRTLLRTPPELSNYE